MKSEIDLFSHWLTCSPIAHRGLHNSRIPENSMAAFAKAIAAGLAIEIDVRLSSDNVVMVFHDREMFRLTGLSGNMSEYASIHLSRMFLKGTEQTIPTLQEVLDFVAGRVPLLIEYKSQTRDGYGTLETESAKLLDSYQGEFAVQSFNPYVVKWFAVNRPQWIRGQLASHFPTKPSFDFHGLEELRWLDKFLLRHLLFNWISKPMFIGYDVRALPALSVRYAHIRGLPISTWTVDTEEKRDIAYRYGDNITFEGIPAYRKK